MPCPNTNGPLNPVPPGSPKGNLGLHPLHVPRLQPRVETRNPLDNIRGTHRQGRLHLRPHRGNRYQSKEKNQNDHWLHGNAFAKDLSVISPGFAKPLHLAIAFDNPAILHPNHPVGTPRHLRAVGDHQQRHPLRIERVEQV